MLSSHWHNGLTCFGYGGEWWRSATRRTGSEFDVTCSDQFIYRSLKAAVAGAPVTMWEAYDTGYTGKADQQEEPVGWSQKIVLCVATSDTNSPFCLERYMAQPRDNPDGYKKGSVLERIDSFPDECVFFARGKPEDTFIVLETLAPCLREQSFGCNHNAFALLLTSFCSPLGLSVRTASFLCTA